MKKIVSLRTLVCFSFVIFCLPFLRTCSDEGVSFLTKETIMMVEPDSHADSDAEIKRQARILEEEKFREELIAEKKKESTYNFYEMLHVTFFYGEPDYNISILKDKTFYPFFGFLLNFIISVLLVPFAFLNKYNICFKLSILNLVLLLLSISGLILTGIVEDWNQIKIGQYLFVLNSILIVWTARNQKTRVSNFR